MKRLLFGLAIGAIAALPARGETEIDAGPVAVKAGGVALLGTGWFIGDDSRPGEAGFGRSAEGVQAYLLAKLSADMTFDQDLAGGLFVRVKPYETPGWRSDLLPDRDEVVKDAYVRLRSRSLGELRLGYQADVRVNQAFYALQVCNCADGFFGSNTPEVTFAHGPVPENSTAADLDSRVPKIAWYSPTEEGLRLALSYGPGRSRGRLINGRLDAEATYSAPDGAQATELRDGVLRQFWSASALWQTQVEDVGLGAEAGVSGAAQAGHLRIPGRNEADPLVWDAGISVSYAAWKLGAAYEQQNFVDLAGTYGAAAYRPAPNMPGAFLPPATNGIVTRTFDVGFTYSFGPVTAGVAWSRGSYEGLVSTVSPKTAADNDVVFGGVGVAASPGVDVLAGLQWTHYTPQGAGSALPGAGLNGIYGGSDRNLNIFARAYDSLVLLAGVALRF